MCQSMAHANVPSSYKPLGPWCKSQRIQHRRLLEGLSSGLTPDRVQQLQSVGFVWSIYDQRWNQKYEELTKFYHQHGHSLVPNVRDSPLGIWVHGQRGQYALYTKGKPSGMTQERIARLQQGDFCWDARDALWQERYQQLLEYRDNHGDW